MGRILNRLIQRHHQQIQIGPQLPQTFSKAVTTPAPHRASPRHDLTEVVFTCVTQDRLRLIRIGERRGFGPHILRQLQRA